MESGSLNVLLLKLRCQFAISGNGGLSFVRGRPERKSQELPIAMEATVRSPAV